MVTAIKFMQSLDQSIYAMLRKDADERGITMQELIRAVVIPEWYRNCNSDGRNASH